MEALALHLPPANCHGCPAPLLGGSRFCAHLLQLASPGECRTIAFGPFLRSAA